MDITVMHFQGRLLITLLRLRGELNGSSYLDLIERARHAHTTGTRHVILDLSDVTHIGSAGLVALHQVAAILRGETPPDPENGWEAFRAVAEDLARGAQPRLKLVGPRPEVERALARAGFTDYLEVCVDVEAALAAFMSATPSPASPGREMPYMRAMNPGLPSWREARVRVMSPQY